MMFSKNKFAVGCGRLCGRYKMYLPQGNLPKTNKLQELAVDAVDEPLFLTREGKRNSGYFILYIKSKVEKPTATYRIYRKAYVTHSLKDSYGCGRLALRRIQPTANLPQIEPCRVKALSVKGLRRRAIGLLNRLQPTESDPFRNPLKDKDLRGSLLGLYQGKAWALNLPTDRPLNGLPQNKEIGK